MCYGKVTLLFFVDFCSLLSAVARNTGSWIRVLSLNPETSRTK